MRVHVLIHAYEAISVFYFFKYSEKLFLKNVHPLICYFIEETFPGMEEVITAEIHTKELRVTSTPDLRLRQQPHLLAMIAIMLLHKVPKKIIQNKAFLIRNKVQLMCFIIFHILNTKDFLINL